MSTPLQIFQSQGLWAWWLQNNGKGTNPFNGVTEKGIDFANSYGTPIGAIQGGQVIVREHFNNSIGDLVVIQSSSGYWLYQHLTSSLQLGDTIPTGGIVGTENGLPVDVYSTGPHIEVRYSPTYNTKIDSWLQPWINPLPVFTMIGNEQDNTGIPFTTSIGGQLSNTLNSTNLLSDSTNPLNNVLGGFDFTRFIDATILFILALTFIIVGFVLLMSKTIENNSGTIAKIAGTIA